MRFFKGVRKLSSGRLSAAIADTDGINFFIDTDGAIVKKRLDNTRRQTENKGVVSYGNDFAETAFFKAERVGGKVMVTLS